MGDSNRWDNHYLKFMSILLSVQKTENILLTDQEKHHSNKTFQEEFRDFLKKYHVEYYEKYDWD